MQAVIQTMFALLQSQMDGTIPEAVPSDLLAPLYQLSVYHDMAHLAGEALEQCGCLPKDTREGVAFRKQKLLSIFRYEQFSYTYTEICNALEDAQIPYLPLKGAVLRGYYPAPWMRTSCDIDILVHKEDLNRAVQTLTTKLSYRSGSRGYHDVPLYSPGGVHLELHFSMQEAEETIDRLLCRAWEYAFPKEYGRFEYVLQNEFLIFHCIAHMSHHVLNGGCGIRPFLDLRLLLCKVPYDEKILQEMCAQCELVQFYGMVKEMLGVWFDHAFATSAVCEFQSYILRGGTYGSMENHASVKQQKKRGALRVLFSFLFLPYYLMKEQYPILQKRRFLLPVYWVRRWFHAFYPGRLYRVIQIWKVDRTLSAEQKERTANLLRQLGL